MNTFFTDIKKRTWFLSPKNRKNSISEIKKAIGERDLDLADTLLDEMFKFNSFKKDNDKLLILREKNCILKDSEYSVSSGKHFLNQVSNENKMSQTMRHEYYEVWGMVAYKEKSYSQAEDYYRRILNEDSKNQKALYGMIQVYLEIGKIEEIFELIKRLDDVNQGTNLLANKCNKYLSEQNWSLAEELLDKLVDYYPCNTSNQTILLSLSNDLHSYEKTVSRALKAFKISEDNRNQPNFIETGIAYAALQSWDKALYYFEELSLNSILNSSRRTPDSILYVYALSYEHQGKKEKAIALLENALSKTNMVISLELLIDLLIKQGAYTEASKHINKMPPEGRNWKLLEKSALCNLHLKNYEVSFDRISFLVSGCSESHQSKSYEYPELLDMMFSSNVNKTVNTKLGYIKLPNFHGNITLLEYQNLLATYFNSLFLHLYSNVENFDSGTHNFAKLQVLCELLSTQTDILKEYVSLPLDKLAGNMDSEDLAKNNRFVNIIKSSFGKYGFCREGLYVLENVVNYLSSKDNSCLEQIEKREIEVFKKLLSPR